MTKKFGTRDRDGLPTRFPASTPRDGTPTGSPALTPSRDEPSTERPVMADEPSSEKPVMPASLGERGVMSASLRERVVMPASLRDRVIEQIEPAVAATVSRDVLRRQIEEIIHGIANQDRLELSGREQFQLADEIADDMTSYGPLRPLLLDESIADIMVNGPTNV